MMAILERLDFGDNQLLAFLAGGSLIHPLIVLTTAHNLQNASADLLVRGGEWNTQSVDEMLPHVERDVLSVSYHNQFVRKNLQNDIALAFLKKPFEIAPHINTICLPELNQPSSASNCIATGWGKKKFGSREQYQVFLKKVELPIVPRDTCQEQLRLTRLGEDFELHDGFLCAGGVDGVDTCTGDGGKSIRTSFCIFVISNLFLISRISVNLSHSWPKGLLLPSGNSRWWAWLRRERCSSFLRRCCKVQDLDCAASKCKKNYCGQYRYAKCL